MMTTGGEHLGYIALELHEKGRHERAREFECFAETLEDLADEAYARTNGDPNQDYEFHVAVAMYRRMAAEEGHASEVYDA